MGETPYREYIVTPITGEGLGKQRFFEGTHVFALGDERLVFFSQLQR